MVKQSDKKNAANTCKAVYVHLAPDGFVLVVREFTKDCFSWKEATAYASLSEASFMTKVSTAELEAMAR